MSQTTTANILKQPTIPLLLLSSGLILPLALLVLLSAFPSLFSSGAASVALWCGFVLCGWLIFIGLLWLATSALVKLGRRSSPASQQVGGRKLLLYACLPAIIALELVMLIYSRYSMFGKVTDSLFILGVAMAAVYITKK